MCWKEMCLSQDPCFLCEWHTGLGEDPADQGWPGSMEGCHKRKSPHLVMFSPAAARNTDGDSRIGTWLRFSKDRAAGLVSRSVECGLGVKSC